jgi:hypothetical protein
MHGAGQQATWGGALGSRGLGEWLAGGERKRGGEHTAVAAMAGEELGVARGGEARGLK